MSRIRTFASCVIGVIGLQLLLSVVGLVGINGGIQPTVRFLASITPLSGNSKHVVGMLLQGFVEPWQHGAVAASQASVYGGPHISNGSILPTYGALIQAISRFLTPNIAAMVLGVVALALAVWMFHMLVEDRCGTEIAHVSAVAMVLFPGAFVLHSGDGTALVLLAVMLTFYCCENGQFGRAGIAAACALVAGPVGVLAMIPLGVGFLRRILPKGEGEGVTFRFGDAAMLIPIGTWLGWVILHRPQYGSVISAGWIPWGTLQTVSPLQTIHAMHMAFVHGAQGEILVQALGFFVLFVTALIVPFTSCSLEEKLYMAAIALLAPFVLSTLSIFTLCAMAFPLFMVIGMVLEPRTRVFRDGYIAVSSLGLLVLFVQFATRGTVI